MSLDDLVSHGGGVMFQKLGEAKWVTDRLGLPWCGRGHVHV